MGRLAVAILFSPCLTLVACAPASIQTAADVRLVNAEPRCEKIGVVEGTAGNAQRAREKTLEQAAERGATHITLESPHPDLEDGMAIVVTGRIFRCPPTDEVYPATGYR